MLNGFPPNMLTGVSGFVVDMMEDPIDRFGVA
jgi:hypothetical protein